MIEEGKGNFMSILLIIDPPDAPASLGKTLIL